MFFCDTYLALGKRFQVSAPPLGASTQFDRKRNFGRHSFIRGVRVEKLEELKPET
jgi:hypothetical protein